ncbi:hypothetical protein BZG36_05600 [Bifiguratus adelaidae]|uniref:Transcription factor domain-containing protein n=1 Tax=Bifiguratus adelaidae TaxID=1938954 RepID=A0A261XUC1_9FUNG|nr:hypothetical protein BZG36_05600 [Bifiguratus adelaidae]
MPDEISASMGAVKCTQCLQKNLECVQVRITRRKAGEADIQKLFAETQNLIAAMDALNTDLSSQFNNNPYDKLPTSTFLSQDFQSPQSIARTSAAKAAHNNSVAKASAAFLLPDRVVARKWNFDGTHQPPRSMAMRLPDGRLLEWIVSLNGQGLSIWTNVHSLAEWSQFISRGWPVYTKEVISSLSTPSLLKAPSKSTGTVLRTRQGRNIFANQDYEVFLRLEVTRSRDISIDTPIMKTLEPHRWVPHLVTKYFTINPPFYLHERTFWKHYRGLDNLMDSGVIMAMCALVIVEEWYVLNSFSTRKFSPDEARELSEFYVSRALELAADSFDNASLYTLKIHAILVHYYKLTRRIKSSTKHASHALRIGYTIQPSLEEPPANDGNAAAAATENIERQEWIRIMWSLYRSLLLFWYMKRLKTSSISCEELWARIEVKAETGKTPQTTTRTRSVVKNFHSIVAGDDLMARFQALPMVDALPDETLKTRSAIKNFNHITVLAKKWYKPDDPFTDELLMHILDVPTFSSIDFCLKLETDLLEWASRIPDEIKYSDAPLQPMSMQELIQNVVTTGELEALSQFWIRWILIHFRFLPQRVDGLLSPISAQEQFEYKGMYLSLVAAKNLLTGLEYVFDYLQGNISLSNLRIVCDVSWVVAHIDGLDNMRVRSAKQNILTGLLLFWRYFQRLNQKSSPWNLPLSNGDDLESLQNFAASSQLSDIILLGCGYGVKGEEQRMFLTALQDSNVQGLLREFATDRQLPN